MESIKEKTPMVMAIIFAIVIFGVACYFFEFYQCVYYTKIDNTRIEKLSTTDDMKYEYCLDCYNEKGKKKEIKFKTSRELREDAYLSLLVKATGVNKWEEIQYNELPEKVKINYAE